MSEGGISFDAIAIGLAVIGVLVAYALHVFRSFNEGAKALVDYADSRAQAQREALAKGEPSLARRAAGGFCITALVVILAYAFVNKIHLF
ncbi:MAG: hypothetical protein K2Y29_02405 [Beijerinckiaceae bacterium]|nr:hypothetical protein [Beijerinckiaceae bacterium]